MIPVQGLTGAKVAILGLGRSGLSAARALAAGGAVPICWDDNPAARAAAQAEGFDCVDLGKAGVFDDIARLIVSPGIPHLYPAPNPVIVAAQDAAVPVDNDIGLFFQSFATLAWDNFDVVPKIIAITGSNGKSTTSALVHHILKHAGRPTQLAGNIGRGVLDIEPAIDGEVVVLELSSYQTDLARNLTPDVAVFTNLSPDHLDRHAGMGGYFAAKRRLFAEGGPDRAVIGVDEPEGRFLAGQLSEGAADDRVIRVSVDRKLTGLGWQVFARKGFLSEYRGGKQIGSIDLRSITGRGVVRYVNDSKATNVDSAAKALAAFKNIRWICGGLEKEGGLGSLSEPLETVRKAYVIGREAAQFAMKLGVEAEVCGTMDVAVARAVEDAEAGDVVLLAPAAASFDQYDSFERRGEDFVAQVQKHLTDT